MGLNSEIAYLGRPIVVRRVGGTVQRVRVGERLHESVKLRAESIFEIHGGRGRGVHGVPLAFPPLGPPVFEPYLRDANTDHGSLRRGVIVIIPQKLFYRSRHRIYRLRFRFRT